MNLCTALPTFHSLVLATPTANRMQTAIIFIATVTQIKIWNKMFMGAKTGCLYVHREVVY